MCVQLAVSAQLYLGVNGGYPATAIMNQNNLGFQEPDYKITFGETYGGVVGYQLSYNTGVVVNVNYNNYGQKYEDSFWDGDLTKEIDLRYLSIPVLFEWLPGAAPSLVYLPSKAPQFYMMYGAQFGILLDATVTQDWSGSPDDAPTYPVDNTQLFNNTDVAFVAEHGIQYFYNQRWFFNAGIRCVFGITDINASQYHIPDHINNYLPTGEYEASRNGAWGVHITASYLFGKLY